MNDGRDPGLVVIGVFLIICGICIVLVGGGCTIFLLMDAASLARDGLMPFLFLSLLGLGIGAVTIWGGVRLMKPGDE